MNPFIVIPLILLLTFAIGFIAGYYAYGQDNEKEWEDTELLDAMEKHQIDVDVFHNRNTEYPEWKVYHPRDAAGYDSETYTSARNAIRGFLEQNHM